MKILYIHQYFVTPSESGGTRSYWIAKELVKNGHQVTVLTSSINISSRTQKQKIDGIDVMYLKVYYDQKMQILERAKSFFQFMWRSSMIAFRMKDVDLVIATSTPLTVGLPALLLKKIKHKPYIFEVRDLWPEVPIQMKGIQNPILISLLKWFEKTIYRNAVHIVALSPGMADGVKQCKIDKDKVSTIPNMAKVDQFWPREKNNQLIKDFRLRENSFKIVHFGALGIANGASYIIEGARLLKNNENVEFVFIGGGSEECNLKNLCNEYDLKNVHFLGKFPMAKTSEIVNLCDVSIVSFMDLPILYTNSPNKLFDSLSAGKPIIVNSAGWTKELVEEYQCGYYVNPNKPEELVERILFLYNNLTEINKLGEASRLLAEQKYDKSILCQQFLDIVESLPIKNNASK